MFEGQAKGCKICGQLIACEHRQTCFVVPTLVQMPPGLSALTMRLQDRAESHKHAGRDATRSHPFGLLVGLQDSLTLLSPASASELACRGRSGQHAKHV